MKKLQILMLATTMTMLAAMTAEAGMVLTTPAQVVRFQTYTDYANGDVIFELNASTAGCSGFWLTPADGGYKQAYAALLLAKASQLRVVVYAYDDQLWAGSAAPFCKVRSISVE